MTEDEAKTKWCPVVGFDRQFEVSDTGRVRSLPRRVRRHDKMIFVHGCELRVCLSGNDGQALKFVHVLVAEAFLPPRPSSAHMVNHKNGKRDDNRVENLEWVTASENQLHSWRVLGRKTTELTRMSAPKGEDNGRAVLSNADAESIRQRRKAGETCVLLAKEYGVHPSQISRVSRRISHCGLAGRP